MKFSCEKAILLDALSTASIAVSSKPNILALEGFLLKADECLEISAYNLETGIRTQIDASIEQSGAVVLSARLLLSIIRKLPDERVTITVSENFLASVTAGEAVFEIPGLNPEDYPNFSINLNEIRDEKYAEFTFDISQKALKSMISETIFAVSTNDSKPIMTGLLFDVTSGEMLMVGVDGYRLAVRRESIDRVGRAYSFVVPAHTVREIDKMIGESDEKIVLIKTEKHAVFALSKTILFSRVLEGEFLNYKTAIPPVSPSRVKVSVDDVMSSVERVSVVVDEKVKSPIRAIFNDYGISLSCNTAIGKSQDKCSIRGGSADLTIGFNSRFMLDALRVIKEKEVYIDLNNNVSPILIKPLEGQKFLYLILPIRIKENDS